MEEYSKIIEKSSKMLQKAMKSKAIFNSEREMMELIEKRYKLNYVQIHKVLAPKRYIEANELEIRRLIKEIHSMDLAVCKAKRNKMEEYVRRARDEATREQFRALKEWWGKMYENNFALVAFRSLEHWALFSEWDKEDGEKFWKYSIDTFDDKGWSGCTKGIFYYGNKMVLDNKIKFMMKQLPTSFGKSFSDSVMISFIFGIDPKEQVIKVVGNRSLFPKCSKQVVDLMINKRFRQVFPEYAEGIDESKDIAAQIFSICKPSDGMFTIKGSGRDTSFECFSKETNRDGIRGGWLFLDDIVQREERMKLRFHQADMDRFNGTWKKRSRDEKTFRIVCGGTTYDIYDLLSSLRFRYSGGELKKSKINKWTELNIDETAVFVKVPKLDENDKLTFPQKTVLSSVLKDRKEDYALFMAMDMQEPLAPEDTPFYWDSIKQYEFVPSDASEYCFATLDPARTGDNYVSMPIFKVVNEMSSDGEVTKTYYLIDCLYMKATMDVVYPLICNLIIKHNIIRFYIEKNTDTSLKYLLEKLLHERGIYFCDIEEVYSCENKEARIYDNETLIKNVVVFPKRDMYSRNSQMGRFEEHIISYKYKGAEYDDSIDSVAMFTSYFVKGSGKKAEMKLIYL